MLADLIPGQLDPMASPATKRVNASQWHEVAQTLKENGATIFEWLSAADFGAHLDVALHVRDGGEGVIIVAAITSEIQTVTDLWAGARWHERETAELFGITFIGHDTERLLLEDIPDVHAPLRRSFALQPRIEKKWPAADSLRRGQLPPGVNPEWTQQ